MTSMLQATHTPPRLAPALTTGVSVRCPDPDCGQTAQIVDTWVWSSTDGSVPHARTRCRVGHVFTPPSDWLIRTDASLRAEASVVSTRRGARNDVHPFSWEGASPLIP